MAYTLKFRRGTSFTSPQLAEPFFNTNSDTLQVGDGSSNITLVKLGSNTGDINFTGDITATNLNLSGDANITGNIILGGNITLGDSGSDEIQLNASLSGSLIPDNGSVYDIGSSTRKYKNLYVESASIENPSFPGSGLVSTSQQIDDFGFLQVGGDGVFSGSSQVVLESADKTGFTGASSITTVGTIATGTWQGTLIDKTYLDDEVLNTSLNSYTSSNDINITNIHSTTSSFEDRLNQLSTETGSIETEQAAQDVRLNQLSTETGSISTEQAAQDVRLNQLSTETGSIETEQAAQDVRLDQLSTETGSIETEQAAQDVRLDQLSTETGSITTEQALQDSRLDNVETFTSSIDINISNIHSTTSSFESRLDLLSDVSHSHSNKTELDTINQNLSTTSDVTFNTGSFTGNMTVTGDLTVLGSSTEISSTELRIEDKLITVASGSADSAAADGAGLEIDGAGKSLKWDHNTSQFVLDAKVSSSVGFKGEGGELTGIDTDQVTEAGNLYYTDARVKQKMTDEVAHSGSFLGTATTSNLDEGTNLYWTETRFSASLDDRTVLSGSTHINDSLNSYTASNDTTNTTQNSRLDQLSTETGSISTEQAAQDSRLTNIEANTGSYLTTVDISDDTNLAVSDTSTVNMTLSDDTLSADVIGGVVSGSEQLSGTFLSKLGDSVVSSSAFSSPSQGTIRATINGIDTDVDSGLQTSDSPSFEGMSLTSVSEVDNVEYTALFISSSNLLGTRELGTAAFLHYSNSIADGNSQVIGTAQATKNYIDAQVLEAGAGDITAVTPTPGGGLSGGGEVGHVSMSLDTGSAHFLNGVSAAGAPQGTISGSEQITSLGFISSSDSTVSLNAYTASNDINITNIHSTTASFDGRLSNIESFTSSLDDSYVTESELAAATGALETKDNEQDSRLSNIESFTSSLDDSYVTEAELAAATGALETKDSTQDTRLDQLSTETGSISTEQSVQDSRLDQLSTETGSISTEQSVQDSRLSNIEAATGSYLTTVDISTDTNLAVSDTSEVNMILTDDTLSAELIGGVVSGSSQVLDILSSINTYTSSNDNDITELFSSASNHEGRIDTLEGDVHEDPLTFSDTTNVDLIRTGDVITANLKGGVVSGSSQVNFTELAGISSNIISASSDTSQVDMIINGGSISANLKGGVVSGSSQITFADLNGLPGGIVSGSSQLTSTFDSRYVNATGNESISGNKTFDNNVVISGDLNVAGTTTYTSTNNVNIGDNILELNFGGSATTSGLLTKDSTGGSTTSGSLLWDATNDYWKAGKFGSEAKILLSLGDGVVSGSDQITKTLQEVTTAGNTTSNAVSITNSTASTTKTTGALVVTGGVGVSGAVNVGGDVVAFASSDKRLKDEIIPISNPLEKINKISGNSFVWNEEKQNIYKGKDYGVIAQEIEKVLPELVQTREDGYKAVKYDKIVSLLIEGIKELSKEVTDLKNRLG